MKVFTGKVVSKKSEKTITVLVERIVTHPIYGKKFKRTKKYHVHDEVNSELGQVVKFVASRPYSKTKKWKVIQTEKRKVEIEPNEIMKVKRVGKQSLAEQVGKLKNKKILK